MYRFAGLSGKLFLHDFVYYNVCCSHSKPICQQCAAFNGDSKCSSSCAECKWTDKWDMQYWQSNAASSSKWSGGCSQSGFASKRLDCKYGLRRIALIPLELPTRTPSPIDQKMEDVVNAVEEIFAPYIRMHNRILFRSTIRNAMVERKPDDPENPINKLITAVERWRISS